MLYYTSCDVFCHQVYELPVDMFRDTKVICSCTMLVPKVGVCYGKVHGFFYNYTSMDLGNLTSFMLSLKYPDNICFVWVSRW